MTWLLANWRLVALVAALLGAGYGAWEINDRAYDRGYAKRVAEEAKADREKTDAANRADDIARRCGADPDCWLRNDGYRRN